MPGRSVERLAISCCWPVRGEFVDPDEPFRAQWTRTNSMRRMWAVTNRTPYAVGRGWGRDKNGVHEWIVAVKATYLIGADGRLSLADEQLPPLLAPTYNGDDGASSLRYEADLVGFKPETDVIVNGTAYAPHGRPTAGFRVSLRVGTLHKAINVVGDRVWRRGGIPS